MNKQNVALYESLFLTANNYSKSTKRVYMDSLHSFLDFLGDREITKSILIEYRDHLISLPVSIQTKNLKIIPVRSFLKFLNSRNESETGSISYKEFFTTLEDRSGTSKHITTPSSQEITNLLCELDSINHKYFVFAHIALATGMRIAEILSLQKGQVQKDFYVVGKGSKQRPVFCTEPVVELVREYEKTIKTQNLFGVTPNQVQGVFRKVTGGKITPHTLRHYFAITMVKGGVDIRFVQEFLGHSSIVTTQRYTQVSKSTLAEVYRKNHSSVV
jgi:integrase/recombinase XerD